MSGKMPAVISAGENATAVSFLLRNFVLRMMSWNCKTFKFLLK
jgi:hypothetical protein